MCLGLLFAEVSQEVPEVPYCHPFILVLYENSGIVTSLLCASEVLLVICSGYGQG